MKKMFVLIFTLVLFIAACRQSKEDAVTRLPEVPKLETTSAEPIVNDASKDLNNVNSVEEELSAEALNDLDTGLADLENI